uniref:Uncharacterized protein n=1 Tax=Wuchereria bancrofti TaxID=6293 RepID=A0AAF5Q6G0_WUCBA
MNVVTAQQYIWEMIRLAGPGMKVIMIDKCTTTAVSCVYAQSNIMQKEVYLFERIDSIALRYANLGRPIKYLKCTTFLLPTAENIHLLTDELRFPKYGQYYIFFYSCLTPVFTRYLNFMKLSFFRSVKWRSFVYQRSSRDSKMLAEEVAKTIAREESLFENAKTDARHFALSSVIPIFWVHETVGINNHRVNINTASTSAYNFVFSNMYANFGEVSQNIKELITDFQRKSQTNQKFESVADMKSFVEQYPQFKKIAGIVTKHLTVLGELSKLVTTRNLLEISEVEQQIASGDEHSHCPKILIMILFVPLYIAIEDAIRLVMLYALRFENNTNSDIHGLVQLLRGKGIIRAVLDFGGSARWQNDLFDGIAIHPYITELIDSLSKNRLSDTAYPYILPPLSLNTKYSGTNNFKNKIIEISRNGIDNITLFLIGDATYENHGRFIKELLVVAAIG